MLPLTSASEIFSEVMFKNCDFSNFQNYSGLRGFESEQIVSNQSNFESKNIRSFKTVHPRQILHAEVEGNKRYV